MTFVVKLTYLHQKFRKWLNVFVLCCSEFISSSVSCTVDLDWIISHYPRLEAEIACSGLIICGLHCDLVHLNLWFSLKVWPHCGTGLLWSFFLWLRSDDVILFWPTAGCDCRRVLPMIFRVHSPLTLLVWLSVPEQYSTSHHTLPSLYGPLFPDQALISSALNEARDCGFYI